MPLSAEEIAAIAVGKCYATKKGLVRRVVQVTATHVTYEALGGKHMEKGTWNPKIPALKERFAKAVAHEVPCDFRRGPRPRNSD